MKYVLYHAKCYDGFGAAYAAWKKLGDTATYIPVNHGEPVPDLPGAREIFIVDFSYKKDVIQKLIAQGASVTVLDHHKTAEAELAGLKGLYNPFVVFDMNKSGALITWEHFHGVAEVPALIQHISDRDLWQYKIPGTAEVHKALVGKGMDFELWDKLDVEVLKKEGAALTTFHDQLVNNVIASAWFMELAGHKIPVVNTSIAWSEVGHELCKKFSDCPFSASFTVFEKNVRWSLRSVGDFDVSEIAKKFGGGGHKNAAGFETVRP